MITIPAQNGEDAYLTTQELADWLCVHRSYISDLRRLNQAPPSFRFGRLLYTRRSEVVAWLAQTEEEFPYFPPSMSADESLADAAGAEDTEAVNAEG